MRWRRGLVVLVVLAGVVALPSGPVVGRDAAATGDGRPDGIHRRAGADRYATAVQVVRGTWDTAPHVLLARGDDFPDALAAAWLSSRLDAPLLLTPTEALHPETRRELQRLRASEVTLLGGTSAIGEAVRADLEELGLTVHRIAGSTRVETAARVAAAGTAAGDRPSAAVLVRADDFADALAAASLAAATDAPILLTGSAELHPVTGGVLDELLPRGSTVHLAGGAAALSADVEEAVSAAGFDASRLAGQDRYGTAAALARAAVAEAGPFQQLAVASGATFADALAAGPAAIHGARLLVLAPPAVLPTDGPTITLLRDLAAGGPVTAVQVAGGPGAVVDGVLTAIDAALHGPPDLILHGGPVVSMTAEDPEAVAVRGRRIVATGPEDAVLGTAGPDTTVVDLGGDAVVPGFVDAHTHVLGDRERSGIPSVDDTLDRVVANGFTTLVELYVHPPRVDELLALDAASRLPIRVEAFLPLRTPEGGEVAGEPWSDHTPYQRLSEHVRVAGAKLHLDWLEDTNYDVGTIMDIVGPAHDAGWTVSMHAINRASATQALTVVEALLDEGPNAPRHRIEHLLTLTDAMIDRIVASGVIASVQVGGTSANLFNSARNHEAYVEGQEDGYARWRDLDEAGARMVGSTDSPWFLVPDEYPGETVPQDVWQAFDLLHGTVTRTPMFGPMPPEFVTDQAIASVRRALELLTVDGAHALDREWEIGRIRPGFLADLLVATDDPLSVPVADLDDIEVLTTISEGESVHCTDGVPCPMPFARQRGEVTESG